MALCQRGTFPVLIGANFLIMLSGKAQKAEKYTFCVMHMPLAGATGRILPVKSLKRPMFCRIKTADSRNGTGYWGVETAQVS